MGEFIIELKGLQFYSFHGLYAEEKKVGGEFVVDVLAKLDSSHHEVSSIKETVNYAEVFEIIKKGNGSAKRIIGNINPVRSQKKFMINSLP